MQGITSVLKITKFEKNKFAQKCKFEKHQKKIHTLLILGMYLRISSRDGWKISFSFNEMFEIWSHTSDITISLARFT